jgi:hypothetical protein
MSFENVMKARKAITDKEGKKRGVQGEVDCPVCTTGKVRYSIAGVNGHIHAACTTVRQVDGIGMRRPRRTVWS